MTIVVEGSPFGNGSTTWYLALDPHPQTYDWPSIGFWPTILWHIPPKLMLVKGPNSCWLKGPRFWWKIPISDGWIASNPKFLYGNTVTWFNMVEHPATQLSMVSTCLDHSPFLSAGTITVPPKTTSAPHWMPIRTQLLGCFLVFSQVLQIFNGDSPYDYDMGSSQCKQFQLPEMDI